MSLSNTFKGASIQSIEQTTDQEAEELVLNNTFLTVRGKRFHYIWLRDHCLSPECHHVSSFQKIYDVSDHLTSPKPKSAHIQNEQLLINWDEQPDHQSIFPLVWLFSHAYDNANNIAAQVTQEPTPKTIKCLPSPATKLEPTKILWDNHTLITELPHWPDGYDTRFDTWITQLDTLGFVRLRNMPWSALDPFVSAVGPVYELMNFGRYSTVKVFPNSHDLSLSEGKALPPHTDLTYIPAPPVVQLLYCVEHGATGGESMLVDGFRVAEDFRRDHPDYFKVLSESPVQFRQFFAELGYFVSHQTPIINLNSQTGNVTSICFSHKNFGLNQPFQEVERFYEAYVAFSRYLKSPTYQYHFRLEPGDCLLLQNFRMLHGRSAFDAHSGPRHLEVAYLEWIYFLGRRDYQTLKPLYMAEQQITMAE
ncbi:MAG: TauD/TfdA family dioxygenase [Cyanobacteria bacterium P01_F01_bin.53]